MNPEFHQQIQQTRNDMSNECSWNLSQQELLQQVHKAEEVFDQHMCDVNPKLDFPKDRIFLLEVYAGRHSPLTDAVKHLVCRACVSPERTVICPPLPDEPNYGP